MARSKRSSYVRAPEYYRARRRKAILFPALAVVAAAGAAFLAYSQTQGSDAAGPVATAAAQTDGTPSQAASTAAGSSAPPAAAALPTHGAELTASATSTDCPQDPTQATAVAWAAAVGVSPTWFAANAPDTLASLPTDQPLYACWQQVLGAHAGANVVYSVPLIDRAGTSLAAGASGAYDKDFAGLAEQLVSHGQATAYLRLGPDLNCGSCPSYAGADAQDWLRYYRRVVSVMQSRAAQLTHASSGGFRFVWNVTNGPPGSGAAGFDPMTVFPDDASHDAGCPAALGAASPDCWNAGLTYADVVGDDIYDRSGSGVHNFTGTLGGRFWAAFAKSKGKPFAVPAWGIAGPTTDGTTGPAFIEAMKGFLVQNGAIFAVYANQHGQIDSALTSAATPHSLAAYTHFFMP